MNCLHLRAAASKAPTVLEKAFGAYQEQLLKTLEYEEGTEVVLMQHFFSPQDFASTVTRLG